MVLFSFSIFVLTLCFILLLITKKHGYKKKKKRIKNCNLFLLCR